ncbi:MAG: ribbon-helix-helix protein, CopG family [Acidobacteria bacterium]|nr:ribbon-helix-helix protein, CopG family [Acidobacteriota bacterium]
MATQNTIHLPEELLVELRAQAAMEGKSVDELAAEAVRRGLDERQWSDLMEYGQQKGLASGHAEGEVPEIVKRRRRTQGH